MNILYLTQLCLCLQISATLPLTGNCNGTYDTTWIVADLTDLANPIINTTTEIIQTSFGLLANTIDAGLYKIQFISTFYEFKGQPFISDFVYVRFKLQGLIPKITDKDGGVNPTRSVFVDSLTVLDSSGSEDPAEGLQSVAAIPMVRQWNCQTGAVSREAVEDYITSGIPMGATTDCGSLITNISSSGAPKVLFLTHVPVIEDKIITHPCKSIHKV